MGKKKRKAPQLEAWCWYCDREFEDDKVLLQHQKAKHYRCHLCPRRLNTAGGLAVHLTQVHKAEPERLENTLPGRDTFDIEIYGMAGIPERDLAEWKARRAAASSKGGGAGGAGSAGNKRPRIEKMVLSVEALRIQLEAHKALMSGKTPSHPPPGFGPPPGGVPPPPFGIPPPGVGGMYSRPPPGFPPPNMAVPPPGFGAPPPVAGVPPPPGGGGYAGIPPPSLSQSPATAAAAGAGAGGLNGAAGAPSPHQSAIKAGLKSRLVYADAEVSPEEKLASTIKYRYRSSGDDDDDVKPPHRMGDDGSAASALATAKDVAAPGDEEGEKESDRATPSRGSGRARAADLF